VISRLARALAILVLLGVAAGCSPRGAQHVSRETAAGATLIKEIMGPVVIIQLQVPPLHVEREETLTVRLRERTTGAPVSGCSIAVLIGRLESQPVGPSAEGLAQRVALEAREGRNPGVYRVTHRFQASGPHEIIAEAAPSGPGAGWTKIVVGARPVVLGR
jgi:hypothetical protein